MYVAISGVAVTRGNIYFALTETGTVLSILHVSSYLIITNNSVRKDHDFLIYR